MGHQIGARISNSCCGNGNYHWENRNHRGSYEALIFILARGYFKNLNFKICCSNRIL